MAQIKNRQLQKALEAEGLSDALLIKAEGYFYVDAKEGTPLAEKLSMKPSTSIYVNSFKQLTVQQWVEEIKTISC